MSKFTHSTHTDFEVDEGFCNQVLHDFNERCKMSERVRLKNLTQKAKEKFTEQVLLKHFTEQFYNDGTMPDEKVNLPEISNAADNVSARYNRKPRNCLVTVNPRQEISLDKLKTAVERLTSKPVVKGYFYVYEVRSGDTGLHCHMLITYEGRPNNFLRGLKTTFKHICDASNSSILNVKYIADDLMPEKIAYMLGQKKKAKLIGVEDTKKYRIANNLEPYYESNPPLSCRVAQSIPKIEYASDENV